MIQKIEPKNLIKLREMSFKPIFLATGIKDTYGSILVFLLFSSIIAANCNANELEIKVLSIRNGIESQISLDWPLNNKNRVYSSRYFKSQQKLAKKAGLNLSDFMGQPAVSGFSSTNKNMYMLFYNTAFSPTCNREYLIQRVKITKSFYDDNKRKYKETRDYLVEVMKTKGRSIKRADAHYKSYSLNNSAKRTTVVDVEIGCGVIPHQAQGRDWPYDKGSLYELVQNYSPSPGYYDRVLFDFSTKYSFGMTFSVNGIESIKWPYFIKQQAIRNRQR